MRKQKIYWDRVFAAFLVLVFIAAGLVLGIKNMIKIFAKASDESVIKEVSSEEAAEPTLCVCIDAGHGGDEDCGALSADGERYESDDDLKASLLVKKYLEERNVKVVMTRQDDSYIELYDRPEIANRAGCDLFVSIHRNSADTGNGVEIWVNYDKPQKDTLLAQNILDGLEEVGISQNRGVQYGYQGYDPSVKVNYVVNEKTDMPSCLVELGFITNRQDNELFDKNLDAYAESIADSVIKSASEMGLDNSGTAGADN